MTRVCPTTTPFTPAQNSNAVNASNVMKCLKVGNWFDFRERTIQYDVTLKALFAGKKLSVIEKLDFSLADFEKDALEIYFKSLDMKEVYLDFTNIDDNDLKGVQFHYDTLEVVSLQGCDELTDQCLEHFDGFENLRILNLAQTNISASAIKQFQESNPNVTIFLGEDL